MSAHEEQRINAYLEAISYKVQLETNAKIIKLPHITGIQYPYKSKQVWPRNFEYSLEFYVYDVSPLEAKEQIENYLKVQPQEYILNVFSSNLPVLLTAYRNLGYQHAWSNVLMEYKLSTGKKHRPFPESVEVLEMKDIEDVSAVNALEPDFPTSALALRGEHIHNFMAKFDGKLCAKSQSISVNKKFNYIADMYTHPNYRRKRVSASLLHTMHKTARTVNAEYSLLLPSRMTRDIELYQRYGYHEVQPIGVVVPMYCPLNE